MYNITLALDPESKMPMYEQLYRYFVSEIHSGKLKSGEKLPSKRAICSHLGVSTSTVETAYEMLVAEGYMRSRPKSGYYVSDFVTFEAGNVQEHVIPQEQLPACKRSEFDFSTASVDTSLFPYSSWAKLNKEVVYSSPDLLQRGDGQGDIELRKALAEFLAEYRGVSCVPDQIIVGAGIEYLSGLIIRLFPPETVFGVEDPGYTAVFNAAMAYGRVVKHIPLDESGLSVSALETSGVSVAYVTPSHQFPMGITMPADRRSRLLRWAYAAHDRYIIEDDYDSEFRYTSRPIPSMQGMDTGGRVIYTGTFSRSLAPSIRIAYIVLPKALMERYRQLPGVGLQTVSRYEQAVVARFLSDGLYARYLRRVGNLYRRRRAALIAALTQIDGVEISGSGGGIHFLLQNRRLSESELIGRALNQGITLTGLGDYCHRTLPQPSTLVIGYGGLCDDRIDEATKRLRDAWK